MGNFEDYTLNDQVARAFREANFLLTHAIGTSDSVRAQGYLELEQEVRLAFPEESNGKN